MVQAQIRTNSGGSAQVASQKHERIDKELLLLRNLPSQYKLGQKKTALGRVIYVSMIFEISEWLTKIFLLSLCLA